MINYKEIKNPPKLWTYNDETVEDVGTHFVSKSGKKIPIVKVWEDGTPLLDKTTIDK